MGGGGPGGQWMVVVLILAFVSQTWSFCPQYCHCDDNSLTVDCHSASKLMVVPIVLNPRIKGLSLNHNQIKDITMSFQFYGELTHLDLSRNLIGSLGTLNFESLRHLQMLNVSYNSVKAVENGVFQGLPSLHTLDLSGNQIERVEREIFTGLTTIREIILDKNRLEFVDWELFRGLDTLERISIQFNFIQLIEPSANLATGGAPWTLKSLTSLDVSSNQLTRVKNSSLSVFSALSDLNLCCNYIHTLEDKAFSGLPQLRKVNLSQNRIGRIPTQVLDKVSTSLRILDLSSNRISESPEKGSFARLFSLEHLLLNDNPGVTGIHPDAFEDLINLSEFEGDYLTNFTELEGNLLNNKPNLQRFSLRYAKIAVIPEELLTTQVPTGALDVTGNPLDCNCSAWPLFQYLKEHSDKIADDEIIPLGVSLPHNLSQAQYIDQRKPSRPTKRPFYLSSVRCQSPPELSGILVKDLKSSDFSSCFTKDDDFQMLVIIIAASILVLIMLALGVKLCCLGQNLRCRNMLGKVPCCRSKKDLEADVAKNERFFEGLRRDLPPPPPLEQTSFLGANGGKLFFSEPTNPNNSQNQQLFYNYSTSSRKDFDNGPRSTDGGYQIVSNPLVNHHNTSSRNGTHSSKRNIYQPSYNHYNYHSDDDGENEYHNPEVSSLGSNPMLFGYNYENHSHPKVHGHTNGGGEMFLDYNKHKKNKKSHHTLNGRQKQVPSVLV